MQAFVNAADRLAVLCAILAGALLTAAALLITWAMAALSIWFDYADTRTLTLERTQAAALLLDEHTRGALDTAAQIATQAEAQVNLRGLAGVGSSREAWRELSNFDQALDYLSGIMIADAEGDVVLTTSHFGPPGISVAGHLGGLVVGALMALVLAYAPRMRRTAFQAAGGALLLVALLGLVLVRTATLTG